MRTKIKRITSKTVSLAVTALLILAMLFCTITFFATRTAYAHNTDGIDDDFVSVSLSLSNSQFSNASGSYPMTPTDWAGAHIDGGNGEVVAGVVNLEPKAYVAEGSGNEKFKLDQYPEYSTKDKTPVTKFAKSKEHPDYDENALLVNTAPGAQVAYAYSSADMTFAPNSFYSVSVWVKTGDFAPDTGATIKLTGLGENCSFININTAILNLNEDDLGWAEYKFFVRTSPSIEKTVKLSLGIGDAYTDSDEDALDASPRQAHGYAFFDNVSANRISARDFAFLTADFKVSTTRDNVYYNTDKRAMALDLYNTDYLASEGADLGTFSNGLDGWKLDPVYDPDATDIDSLGSIAKNIVNSHADIDPEDNQYGFTVKPLSPLGKAEDIHAVGSNPMFKGTNGNILILSTYNSQSKTFSTAAGGIASPDVTIERFKYYRFGVWVKTDSVSGGTGASIGVKGESNVADNDMKITDADGRVTGVTGDDTDKAHCGWKEQVIYIKGSVIKDCKVHFELWLGSPDGKASGIAMFDNVTFTELSYTDFTEMSGADSGKVLSLDPASESTGIENGKFETVGDYEEFEYPLPPAQWTHFTPDTVTTLGFSKNKVDTEKAIHGIIPSDSESFSKIHSTGVLNGVVDPSTIANAATGNVLLLSSTTPTAFCYQSTVFTASTDKANTVSVVMAVNSVKSGYGASLVLKTEDGSVISTIENITDTHNDYKTFTFYLDAPLSDQKLMLEIWLGLNDRKNNTQKLSAGNVYVKSVSFAEWTVPEGSTKEAEFQTVLDKYLAAINNPASVSSLDFGVYSFVNPSLDYYDAYTYNKIGGFGNLYGWTVSSAVSDGFRGGVFNTENLRDLSVYGDFDKKEESGNMLLIDNTSPNRTTFSYANSLQLVANTYYRLDVTLKVHVTDEIRKNDNIVGATLALKGKSTAKFENIKDTTELVDLKNEDSRDRETFKTYTFFISTGNDGGELGLDIIFGGDTPTSYIQGQLIVADVKLGSINNTAFDAAKADLDENYQKAVEFASADTAEDDNNKEEKTPNDIAWWIIPTVIFSVALLAAIVLIIVMRIRDRVKKKKKTTYTSEYDRSSVIKDLDKLAEDNEKQAEKDDDSPADEADDKENEETPDNEVSDDNKEETATEEKDDAKEGSDDSESQADKQE